MVLPICPLLVLDRGHDHSAYRRVVEVVINPALFWEPILQSEQNPRCRRAATRDTTEHAAVVIQVCAELAPSNSGEWRGQDTRATIAGACNVKMCS